MRTLAPQWSEGVDSFLALKLIFAAKFSSPDLSLSLWICEVNETVNRKAWRRKVQWWWELYNLVNLIDLLYMWINFLIHSITFWAPFSLPMRCVFSLLFFSFCFLYYLIGLLPKWNHDFHSFFFSVENFKICSCWQIFLGS